MRYLRNFNESLDTNLLKPIDSEDHEYWQNRIIGSPPSKTIGIIRKQIDLFEKHFGGRFNIKNELLSENGYVYDNIISKMSDKRSVNVRSNTKDDVYIKVSETDDYWYVIQIYTNWNNYFYLSDDLEGLKLLGDKIISLVSNSQRPRM